MASPSVTKNITILASQSLAAAATVTADRDSSTKFILKLQIKNTGGGTVAATNGLEVSVFQNTSTSARFDTEASQKFIIPTTVSTEKEQTLTLGTGHYRISLKNLDTTNAITVDIIGSEVDAVA